MNKIFLIIQREYLTRIKKKSFLVMTILGPLLMAGVFVVPVWLAMQGPEKQTIAVIDDTSLFTEMLPEENFVHFEYPIISLDEARKGLYNSTYSAVLHIPFNIINRGANQKDGSSVTLYYKNQPGAVIEDHIKSSIEKQIYDYILRKENIDQQTIEKAKISLHISTIAVDEKGNKEEKDLGAMMAVGFGTAILIYMFIFLYGVQVMRGVMEEKSSRIVEVILSSVKPFQLMMGKIIGIAMVGLTQFVLWIIFTIGINGIAQATILKDANKQYDTQMEMRQMVNTKGSNADLKKMEAMKHPNNKMMKLIEDMRGMKYFKIIFFFICYFLGGYLLYSALFAAVGSAIDAESDSQQFMLPITIPLIFSFVMAQTVVQDPSSSLSFWLSIFPLTSPIIMMVRFPFGVPDWQLALSLGMLVLGFLATTWLAARIYRVGILMYGKKVSYKELGKWLFYKG